MRFLVDENAGPAVAAWLRAQVHETFSIFVVVSETRVRFARSV